MQPVDRKTFFDKYRELWGPIEQKQVDGLEFLLGALEGDGHITDLRHAAYMLGTTKWETGNTFQPIKEYGQGKDHKYGIPDPETRQVFFGRGYVQLTWKDNYRTFGKALKLDLLYHPDLALVPENAYRIMSYGMRTGAFTGVGLSRYFNDERTEWLQARKIINGMDQAAQIARYAEKLHGILESAVKETS